MRWILLACALAATSASALRAGASRVAPRAAARARIALGSANALAGLVLAPRREAGFDDKVIGSACVRRFVNDDGEQWLMWYSARGRDFDPDVLSIATGRIGLATSTDGVSWTREGAVLSENRDEWFFFDTAHVGVGDVQVMSSQSQRTGGVAMYWCYYFGGDLARTAETAPKGASMSIGLAMSSNGRNWGRVEGEHANGAILTPSDDPAAFDAAFVGWPQVVMRRPEDYVLYYHTIVARTGNYVVAAARGTDGVKFNKVGPILSAGPPGSFDERGAGARHVIEVKQQDGVRQPRFLMAYEAIDGAGTHSIGLARSDDGLAWTKSGDGPIFAPSAAQGAWDGGAVGRPNLVPLDGGRYRLFYYGQSGKGAASEQEWSGIGVAECDGTDWSAWTRVGSTHDARA
ncbi:hypothetical protein KFE25_012971 [Diacronema lutheri]|uniref:Glycosyl hydrolase family 32 N-terminal domain-containing protein n=2 Tax=Diacronema lutheri TaxID=2081491 RepID=A0A8J6C6X0_DIALT|nr:hypothetical protein KFE25_012971 [Diacronema lutheri]